MLENPTITRCTAEIFSVGCQVIQVASFIRPSQNINLFGLLILPKIIERIANLGGEHEIKFSRSLSKLLLVVNNTIGNVLVSVVAFRNLQSLDLPKNTERLDGLAFLVKLIISQPIAKSIAFLATFGQGFMGLMGVAFNLVGSLMENLVGSIDTDNDSFTSQHILDLLFSKMEPSSTYKEWGNLILQAELNEKIAAIESSIENQTVDQLVNSWKQLTEVGEIHEKFSGKFINYDDSRLNQVRIKLIKNVWSTFVSIDEGKRKILSYDQLKAIESIVPPVWKSPRGLKFIERDLELSILLKALQNSKYEERSDSYILTME